MGGVSILEEAPPNEVEREVAAREEKEGNPRTELESPRNGARSPRNREGGGPGIGQRARQENGQNPEEEGHSDKELAAEPEDVAQRQWRWRRLLRHGLSSQHADSQIQVNVERESLEKERYRQRHGHR